MASNVMAYSDLYAFHPGYYVEEIIEEMSISQAEFAKRMGTSTKTVSLLVAGKIRLTNELAQKLASMMGMTVEVWLNLQKEYDLKVLEIERQKALDEQASIVRLIDYSFFVKVAKLPATKRIEERISYLCGFLRIADLRILTQRDFLVNFRTGISSFDEKNLINAKAWVQTAMNIASRMQVAPFDAEKLKSFLPEIRKMTIQEPEEFLPRLKEIFSECGVRFVLLPSLKNSGINGAVKWFGDDQVMLALNDRRTYADTFWFALFHEIKHILQQKTRTVFISYNHKLEEESDLEKDADRFAADYLITPKDYQEFVSTSSFTEETIISFAHNIGIHPGIVVGRLQNDGRIEHQSKLNHLKGQYRIVV